jgi:hypothetical protein
MSETSTTQSRYIKSYEIRRAYQGGVQYPPAVSGVQGAIDIHCHADAAHQDALSVAKLASKNGMRGILYKSIAGKQRAESVKKVREALHRWCDEEKVEPILCWSGCNVANRATPPSAAKIREQLDGGITRQAQTTNKRDHSSFTRSRRPVVFRSRDPPGNLCVG